MANMSYCRMENTALDLFDCVAAIEAGDYTPGEMSQSELRGLRNIVELAEYITNELEYEIENLINE
jgi:hypothetical protein